MKMNRMMVVAAALAAGTSFGAIRAVTPTDWNGKPGSWQMKRHAEKMRQAAAGGVKVVFIGDSITNGWEQKGRGPAARGIPLPDEPQREHEKNPPEQDLLHNRDQHKHLGEGGRAVQEILDGVECMRDNVSHRGDDRLLRELDSKQKVEELCRYETERHGDHGYDRKRLQCCLQ